MKLTPTVMDGIVNSIEGSALPMVRVASSAGISYQTLRRWLRDGEELQQQLDEGKIKKSDLTTFQKHEVKLFQRVEKARVDKESRYLSKIEELSEEKKDIRGYIYLLKRLHKVYRDDVPDEEGDGDVKTQKIFVTHLFGTHSEDTTLEDEFINGSPNNAETKEAKTDDTGTDTREKS